MHKLLSMGTSFAWLKLQHELFLERKNVIKSLRWNFRSLFAGKKPKLHMGADFLLLQLVSVTLMIVVCALAPFTGIKWCFGDDIESKIEVKILACERLS